MRHPIPPSRLFVIRLSSFGDLLQAQSITGAIKARWPQTEIEWVVREDFKSIIELNQDIGKVYSWPRVKKHTLLSDLGFAWKLTGQIPIKNTLFYDAHNSLRSRIFKLCLWAQALIQFSYPQVITRSKHRLRRFIFFKLRIRQAFKQPVIGAETYLKPLGLETSQPEPLNLNISSSKSTRKTIAIIPATAWANKNWQPQKYIELINRLQSYQIKLIGGSNDQVCDDIIKTTQHSQIENLKGLQSYTETLQTLKNCDLVVGGDTGSLHAADEMQIPAVFIIGPSAFGYPWSKSSRVAEVSLACKPCSKDGRDPCVNPEQLKCMKDISVDHVYQLIEESLK